MDLRERTNAGIFIVTCHVNVSSFDWIYRLICAFVVFCEPDGERANLSTTKSKIIYYSMNILSLNDDDVAKIKINHLKKQPKKASIDRYTSIHVEEIK